jgi:ABC-type glycerol-3-phosphate transport system permease component
MLTLVFNRVQLCVYRVLCIQKCPARQKYDAPDGMRRHYRIHGWGGSAGTTMIWNALKLSLLIVSISTIAIAVLGIAFGFLLARRRFPGKDLLDAALTLPMVLPPTVVGYYLMATSENTKLCVTLHRQNAHLPHVNSAFASVASLDFGVFGGCQLCFLKKSFNKL